ncbi:MAG: hypothetical protein NVSMB52_14370 [Chloroflexota bacterium]
MVPLKYVSYAAGVTAIVEAMAMGKAVIVFDSPGISDYVLDRVCGALVPVGDVQALRQAIIDFWEDPKRTAETGKHNREWIERCIHTDHYVAAVGSLDAEISVWDDVPDDTGATSKYMVPVRLPEYAVGEILCR